MVRCSIQKCNQKGSLLVRVRQLSDKAGLSASTVAITGPTPGSKPTNGLGIAEFTGLTPGIYAATVTLSSANKAKKYTLLPHPKSTGVAAGTQSTLDVFAKAHYGVTALNLPARFAPSVERVGTYEIDDKQASAASGYLELFRTMGNALVEVPIWRRELTDAERTNGHHELNWDGKIGGQSGGTDFPGDWLSVEFSPYKLRLTLPGGSPEKQEATFKVEVAEVGLTVADSAEKRLMMNDPEHRFELVALVKLKKIDGSGVITQVPVGVTFRFTDPGASNTAKVDSFQHVKAPDKYLGKKSDAVAVHFAAHAASASTSSDGYRTQCRAAAVGAVGADQGKAKTWFKPSGVGGDNFTLKASVLHSNGNTLATKEGEALTVWRFVTFDRIYEMQGETHVSVNGSTATIAPVFEPAFVRYQAGAPTAINASQSVKYIGLWTDAATPQQSWTAVQAKIAAETPTADEIRNAKYAGADAALINRLTAARAAIIAKAQAWADRIDSAFDTSMNKWISDAAIPENALVAIKYYHPKYSMGGGDHATLEWKFGEATTPAWLRIAAFSDGAGGHFYTGLDPDTYWTNWGGLSHGSGRVTAPTGNPAAIVKQVVRHEAGHATESFFKRDVFGASLDHSVSNAGIMYYATSGGTTFTDREKKILRGIKP